MSFQAKKSPRPYFTQIPNIFVDEYMSQLNDAELRCLVYLARRTYGFGGSDATLLVDEICNGKLAKDGRRLDRGTGLCRSTAFTALRGLKDKKLIKVDQQMREELGGNGANLYSLDVEPEAPSEILDPAPSENSDTAPSEILDPLPISLKKERIEEKESDIIVAAEKSLGKSLNGMPREREALRQLLSSDFEGTIEKLSSFTGDLKEFIKPKTIKWGGRSERKYAKAPQTRQNHAAPSRVLAPPPRAVQFNQRCPSIAWAVWDESLDNLLTQCESDPEFIKQWPTLLDMCEKLGVASKKNPRGGFFCCEWVLTKWSKVVNNKCDWLIDKNQAEVEDGMAKYLATLGGSK